MLKVGLVGVGGISGAHIPVWEEMENAELVALCDFFGVTADYIVKGEKYDRE